MATRSSAIPLRYTPTRLDELLRSTMEPLVRQARDLDIELRFDAPNDLPIVEVDPEKMAWAVVTVVGNALRYAKRGTRRMPGGSIHVRAQAAPDGSEILVVVQDDGPGIPAAKVPFLFARAAGAAHAAGLGLCLVHDVIEAHGGTIDVTSSEGRLDHGTTITFHVPVR